MRRTIRSAIIGCLLFAISSCAAFYAMRRPAAPVMRASLDGFYSRVLPRVEIRKTTVGAVVDFLREQTGANVVANWAALRDDGIFPETPYDPDLELHDVAVWQVLDRLSHAGGLGRSASHVPPRWLFESQSICFTDHNGFVQLALCDNSQADVDLDSDRRSISTCLHPVADLLLKDGPWERLAIVHGNHNFTPPLTCSEREELLSQTIVALVDRQSWRDEGGQSGSMRFVLGDLLVTQTPANQRAIDRILQTLRAAR